MRAISLSASLAFGLTFLSSASAWAAPPPGFVKKSYVDATSNITVPYQVFLPKGYDKAKKYPIVMFLHGIGERGTDGDKQMLDLGEFVFVSPENQTKHPLIMIVPQCDPDEIWQNTKMNGTLLRFSKQLTVDYAVDDERFYLTGLSMGSFGSLTMLRTDPSLFAGAVALGGGGEKPWDKLKGFPLWLIHASDDKTVPYTIGTATPHIVDYLRDAGEDPIFTEFTSGGHGIWAKAYQNLPVVDWLLAQRRGKAVAYTPSVDIEMKDGCSTKDATLTLSGTTNDASTKTTKVEWTNLGGGTGNATGTADWSIPSLPLKAGTNKVRVLAHGTSFYAPYGGETTFSKTIDVKLDANAPETCYAPPVGGAGGTSGAGGAAGKAGSGGGSAGTSAGGAAGKGGTAGTNAGGASAGGTSAGGTSAGGTSSGGTSSGGASAGGTNAGGASSGGTNAGGSSAGGTSSGGTSAAGASSGGTSAGGTTGKGGSSTGTAGKSGSGAAGKSSGGSGGAAGASAPAAAPGSGDDGGCATSGGAGKREGGLALVGLGLAFAALRRRRPTRG